MTAELRRKYTLEEYFDLERSTNERYEYWDGDIFSMSGVSNEHDLIEGNTSYALRRVREGRQTFIANMRIKVPSLSPYRYADVSALCGQPVFERIGGVDVLTNPTLIVEVLSESTEAYDRGDKFTHYKSIPSFGEYLLVAQHRPHITQYVKKQDGIWSYQEVNTLSDKIHLPSVDCVPRLNEVYEGVAFPEHPSPNIRVQS